MQMGTGMVAVVIGKLLRAQGTRGKGHAWVSNKLLRGDGAPDAQFLGVSLTISKS